MSRLYFPLTIIVSILAISFIALIVFVALLGENNKIDTLVENYFEDIKAQRYLEASKQYFNKTQSQDFSDVVKKYNDCFLLELALLKHYELIDRKDYQIKIRKSHFWLPYASNNDIKVSIALKENITGSVFQNLKSKKESEFIKDLIMVHRNDGSWMISRIDLANSMLASIYNEFNNESILEKYIEMTKEGPILKTVELNAKMLKPIDVRILKFSLHKMLDSIENHELFNMNQEG